jgi:hypothetical protein
MKFSVQAFNAGTFWVPGPAWSRIRKEADLFASIYDPEVFTRHPRGIPA